MAQQMTHQAGAAHKHGAEVSSRTLKEVLKRTFTANQALTLKGLKSLPICVWGRNGNGKTEVIMQFAQENGYDLKYLSLAQLEDMGDLLGLPETFNPTPDVPNNPLITTVYRQPHWLAEILNQRDPSRPGILLIDDFNRADRRIQQGVLQLLQLGKLLTWQLPKHWQIVLTANPDNGSYHVTSLDSATHTRLIHVTLRFDVDCWAEWAREVGIRELLVRFVERNPEVMNRPYTTARTLSALLFQINDISDYRDDDVIAYVRVLGEGCVDIETVNELIDWLLSDFTDFDPATLLNAETSSAALELLEGYLLVNEQLRVERVAQVCGALKSLILDPAYTPKEHHKRNLLIFMNSPMLHHNRRQELHKEITQSSSPFVRALVEDPTLTLKILRGA